MGFVGNPIEVIEIGAGLTASVADRELLPAVAVMVAFVEAVTLFDASEMVVLLCPAEIVLVDATVTALLLLDSATVVPPAGAGPSSVIVPVACCPAVTVAGAIVKFAAAGGETVRLPVRVSPLAVAVRTASCAEAVGVVCTCTVADDCPLPIVIADDASCATFDVIESPTSNPLLAAGPDRVMVAVAGLPPATLVGLNTTLVSEGCPPWANASAGISISSPASLFGIMLPSQWIEPEYTPAAPPQH